MKTNFLLAWLWILLGFISGMVLGLFSAVKTGSAATPASGGACTVSATFPFSDSAR